MRYFEKAALSAITALTELFHGATTCFMFPFTHTDMNAFTKMWLPWLFKYKTISEVLNTKTRGEQNSNHKGDCVNILTN